MPIVWPIATLIDKIRGNKPTHYERGMGVIYFVYSLMLWFLIGVVFLVCWGLFSLI